MPIYFDPVVQGKLRPGMRQGPAPAVVPPPDLSGYSFLAGRNGAYVRTSMATLNTFVKS